MKDEVVLTVEEAAQKYKTSIYTIIRRIKAGHIPASKPYGRYLIKMIDLEKYFKRTSAA